MNNICDLIASYVGFQHNKNQRYLSYIELSLLIREIGRLNMTTRYVRFTPFYLNVNNGYEMELDELMFFVECRCNVTSDDNSEFVKSCIYHHVILDEITFEDAEKHYFLCDKEDVQGFQTSFNTYYRWILSKAECVNLYMIREGHIKEEDVALGSIYFEVHCC